MFLPIFWTAYIPIAIVMFSLVGQRLIRTLRQLRVNAWVAPLTRRPTLRLAHAAASRRDPRAPHSRLRR